MAAFQVDLDIINRGLQHLGRQRIYALDEQSAQAQELAFAYDKLREDELRRNVWKFAIRRAVLRPVDASTVIWTPPAWSGSTTYPAGAIVSYVPAEVGADQKFQTTVGFYWQSSEVVVGSASAPIIPPNSIKWHRYFGPVTMNPFVCTAPVPAAPTLSSVASGALAAATVYVVVTYITATGETLASAESTLGLSANYVVKVTSPSASVGATKYNVYIGTTTGEYTLQTTTGAIDIGTDWTEPTTGLVEGRRQPIAPAQQTGVGFHSGELTLLDATVYSSKVDQNEDTPPSGKWRTQGTAVLNPLDILYPIGAGPVTDQTTRNAYRLPLGFLRKAPLDPRSDYDTFLGAPTGLLDNDWVYEGDFLVTRNSAPLMIRFVADTTDVWEMDTMFCEGVGARLGVEMAPVLVPKDELAFRHSVAASAYKLAIREARLANAIMIGSEAPPIDSYISCRL